MLTCVSAGTLIPLCFSRGLYLGSQSHGCMLCADGVKQILFLLLQIVLSHLSAVMPPATITQIQQLCDATAGPVGCTEPLCANGSWCKHTLGTTHGMGPQTNPQERQLHVNNIHLAAQITFKLLCVTTNIRTQDTFTFSDVAYTFNVMKESVSLKMKRTLIKIIPHNTLCTSRIFVSYNNKVIGAWVVGTMGFPDETQGPA